MNLPVVSTKQLAVAFAVVCLGAAVYLSGTSERLGDVVAIWVLEVVAALEAAMIFAISRGWNDFAKRLADMAEVNRFLRTQQDKAKLSASSKSASSKKVVGR